MLMNVINFSLIDFIRNLLNVDIIFNLNIYLHSTIRINISFIKKIEYSLRLIITLNLR